MPIVKIEPTGCCVHRGKVQVRLSFFLEPSDARYSEHHVQVPIIPLEGYRGAIESLPKKWQNNPFHNHFIYVEPDVTDEVIMDMGEVFLKEAYGKWARKESPRVINQPVKFLEIVNRKRRRACEARVKHLKALERIWVR